MCKYNRIARSLCAVFLSIGLLLTQSVFAVETEGQAEVEGYVYAIDIEFGNLAFYYDYGVWNVNTMRYEAAVTSGEPAVGTEDGFPGWYGFDGQSNLIQITNRSAEGNAVRFSLDYRSLDADELTGAGVTASVSNVTMVVTDVSGQTLQDTWVEADEENPVQWYIHLQGEPQVGTDEYSSSTMNPIGMLTIRIEEWQS